MRLPPASRAKNPNRTTQSPLRRPRNLAPLTGGAPLSRAAAQRQPLGPDRAAARRPYPPDP